MYFRKYHVADFGANTGFGSRSSDLSIILRENVKAVVSSLHKTLVVKTHGKQ